MLKVVTHAISPRQHAAIYGLQKSTVVYASEIWPKRTPDFIMPNGKFLIDGETVHALVHGEEEKQDWKL